MYWDKWEKDDWEEAYESLIYEEEESTEEDKYFDVPIHYLPVLTPIINKLF